MSLGVLALTVAEAAPVVAITGARVVELVVDAGAVVALVGLAGVNRLRAVGSSPAFNAVARYVSAVVAADAVVLARVVEGTPCADFNKHRSYNNIENYDD